MMNDEQYKVIYENLKRNSIGEEKVSTYKPTKRKVKLLVALTTLLIMFLTSCNMSNKVQPKETQMEVYTSDTFSSLDISLYQRSRVINLMASYGYTDYTNINNYREYKYTVEDYQKMEELDETYLYGFYMVTTTKTFNTVLNSLGYKDLNDYLIRNNYVNKDNKPDTNKWYVETQKAIDEMMKEKKGVVK